MDQVYSPLLLSCFHCSKSSQNLQYILSSTIQTLGEGSGGSGPRQASEGFHLSCQQWDSRKRRVSCLDTQQKPYLPESWEENISKHANMIAQNFWYRPGDGSKSWEKRKMSKKLTWNWEGEIKQMEEIPDNDSEHGLKSMCYSFQCTSGH